MSKLGHVNEQSMGWNGIRGLPNIRTQSRCSSLSIACVQTVGGHTEVMRTLLRLLQRVVIISGSVFTLWMSILIMTNDKSREGGVEAQPRWQAWLLYLKGWSFASVDCADPMVNDHRTVFENLYNINRAIHKSSVFVTILEYILLVAHDFSFGWDCHETLHIVSTGVAASEGIACGFSESSHRTDVVGKAGWHQRRHAYDEIKEEEAS